MSDHDALIAAICDQPDEDTPRLVYADWLEENDRPEQAAFVRAQIELARTPPWEPFSVFCKWRRPDWLTGKPFRDTLPQVDGFHVEWHSEAFQRGLGWRLNVRSPSVWEQLASSLFFQVPIGVMHLWGARGLDDWQRFVNLPGLSRLSRLHFQISPIEPLRVLRDAPAALGVKDIAFHRSTGAGMPEVIEDLLAAPLGRVVRGLHFHMGGFESLEALIDALHAGANLERLSLSAMGLTSTLTSRLMNGSAVHGLKELDLRGNMLGNDGMRAVADHLPPTVHTLGLAANNSRQGIEALTKIPNNLRRLNLANNRLAPRPAREFSRSPNLAGLRSLDVSRCLIDERVLRHLTRAKFWPNLVELDLRENPIPTAGVRRLLDAEVPEDLTALVLTGDQLGSESRNELRKKYGDRVVFAASEVVGL